jgi:hypothetical protein
LRGKNGGYPPRTQREKLGKSRRARGRRVAQYNPCVLHITIAASEQREDRPAVVQIAKTFQMHCNEAVTLPRFPQTFPQNLCELSWGVGGPDLNRHSTMERGECSVPIDACFIGDGVGVCRRRSR